MTSKAQSMLKSKESGFAVEAKDQVVVRSQDASVAVAAKADIAMKADKINGAADSGAQLTGGGKKLALGQGKAQLK